MGKHKINKIVGIISKEVADQYNLSEYEGQEIIQSLDLYVHTYKHLNEFNSVDSYNNTITNIDFIIRDPYFVYYEKDRNSLLYFKEIDEYVCAVVKLKLRKNKEHYVATVYPLTKNKVEKFKEKAVYNKYVINK